MAYMVENHSQNQRLSKLIDKFPEKIKKRICLDTDDAFQFFLDSYNPITKDLIAAYILCLWRKLWNIWFSRTC